MSFSINTFFFVFQTGRNLHKRATRHRGVIQCLSSHIHVTNNFKQIILPNIQMCASLFSFVLVAEIFVFLCSIRFLFISKKKLPCVSFISVSDRMMEKISKSINVLVFRLISLILMLSVTS